MAQDKVDVVFEFWEKALKAQRQMAGRLQSTMNKILLILIRDTSAHLIVAKARIILGWVFKLTLVIAFLFIRVLGAPIILVWVLLSFLLIYHNLMLLLLILRIFLLVLLVYLPLLVIQNFLCLLRSEVCQLLYLNLASLAVKKSCTSK